mgnify:CR=1 FL=1
MILKLDKKFFHLKKTIDESKFNSQEIETFYYFQTGRWDLKTKSGMVIKLPNRDIKDAMNRAHTMINDNKLDKFEYPVIILLSILGMFFMVSANDLILFYLGLALQSLSLYILASIDRDNLRSSEALSLIQI